MSLRERLPWTRNPLIINAPMGGFAGADLAIAVSKAGGLGQIGAVFDMKELATNLEKVEQSLPSSDGVLPVGVGVLPFVTRIGEAIPVFKRFRPAVIWLFGARELADYVTWAERIRTASPYSMVWVQVGSVEAALTVARTVHPAVICVQGSDAGGHGFEKGAGIISLLPETADALAETGLTDVHLVAAGGITDGRSAAAAFALGAEGVVMGTRFLAASETTMHPAYRKAILAAKDGSQSTTRCKLFDELKGPNIWPEAYDGRGIVMESWTDHAGGVGIEEIRARHAEAVQGEDGGFGSNGKGRAAMWAGTGVGLVKKQQPAAEIVGELRNAIMPTLKGAQERML